MPPGIELVSAVRQRSSKTRLGAPSAVTLIRVQSWFRVRSATAYCAKENKNFAVSLPI